jgi:hypothetical protein
MQIPAQAGNGSLESLAEHAARDIADINRKAIVAAKCSESCNPRRGRNSCLGVRGRASARHGSRRCRDLGTLLFSAAHHLFAASELRSRAVWAVRPRRRIDVASRCGNRHNLFVFCRTHSAGRNVGVETFGVKFEFSR